MANLYIEDLPEDLHTELGRRAAAQGSTVGTYVLNLLRHDLSLPTLEAWLEEVRNNRPVRLDRPVADLVAEDRAGRSSSLPG